MSAPVSAKARARDIDRAQTCGLLDAGYAEGQLDPTEYESRTATAMKAKTLGELDALVSDLQIPEHLVEAARDSARHHAGAFPDASWPPVSSRPWRSSGRSCSRPAVTTRHPRRSSPDRHLPPHRSRRASRSRS
ncbi:DUF1707 domain-containing protein [Prescottella defluvii]|nr:DUF1707 domain-containing protein [Prescottella defluvii]